MTGRPNPAAGILRVAAARPDGLAQFGTTVPAFLNSLAPLLAFPIAGAFLAFFNDGPVTALLIVLLALIVYLAPPVLSHLLAVAWKREAQWLRYATACNWCYWLLPVVGSLLVVLFGTAVGAGLPELTAAKGVLVCLGLYSLWLNYFLVRHGLELPRGKSILFVVVVNAVTVALAIGPSYLVNGSGS